MGIGQVRITPTTSLNDAIRRISDGDTGAASVVAMLNSQRPQNIMSYLKSLDRMGVYGQAVYKLFSEECEGSIDKFVGKLSE